jgi:hypothetical protein
MTDKATETLKKQEYCFRLLGFWVDERWASGEPDQDAQDWGIKVFIALDLNMEHSATILTVDNWLRSNSKSEQSYTVRQPAMLSTDSAGSIMSGSGTSWALNFVLNVPIEVVAANGVAGFVESLAQSMVVDIAEDFGRCDWTCDSAGPDGSLLYESYKCVWFSGPANS